MKKFKTSASMAFLILVAVVMLFPIYWLFVSSAKTPGELFGGNASCLPATSSLALTTTSSRVTSPAPSGCGSATL